MSSKVTGFAVLGIVLATSSFILIAQQQYLHLSNSAFSLPEPSSDFPTWSLLSSGTVASGYNLSGAVSGTRFAMKPYRRELISSPFQPLALPSLIPRHKVSPMCANWAVLTTINEPSDAVKILLTRSKWCVVVVADLKSVDGTKFRSLIDPILYNGTLVYLTPEDQRALPYRIASSLPWNSFGRKNIGYLYAIHHGATVIFDVDDDNFPKEDIDLPAQIPKVCTFAEDLLFNPYPHFGAPAAWPRGYPLDKIRSSGQGTIYSTGRSAEDRCSNIGMIQSLADHDPDVDALYRLSPSTLPLNFTRRLFPVTIAPGAMAPTNAQALVLFSTCFWASYLPVTVHGRVADIWRGYIALAIMKLTGHQLAFSSAFVTQYRNKHNYLEDFNAEVPLYERAGPLIDFLSDWQCNEKQATVPSCLVTLYISLYEHGILEWADVQHIKNWLSDLGDAGYDFPLIKRASYRPPDASMRLAAPVFSSVLIRGYRMAGGRVLLPPGFSGSPPAQASPRCSEWCHSSQEIIRHFVQLGCDAGELARSKCEDALIKDEPFFPAWSALECRDLCRERPECDGWSFQEPSDFAIVEPESAANKLRDDTWLLDDSQNHERRQQQGGEKGRCVLRTEEWDTTDEFMRGGETTRPLFIYFGIDEAYSLQFTSGLANRRVTLFAATSELPRRQRILLTVKVNYGRLFTQEFADAIVEHYRKAMSKEYTRHVVDVIFSGPTQCFGKRDESSHVVPRAKVCQFWVLQNPWAYSGGHYFVELAMVEQSFPGYKGYLTVHDDFYIGKGIWSDTSAYSNEVHIMPLSDALQGPPINRKIYNPPHRRPKNPPRLGLMEHNSAWFTHQRGITGLASERPIPAWPGWTNERIYPGSVMGVGNNNIDSMMRAFRALHAMSTGWACDPHDCDTKAMLQSRWSDWDQKTPQFLLMLTDCQSDAWYIGSEFAAEMGLTLTVLHNAGVFLELAVCMAAKLVIPERHTKQVTLCTSWTGTRGDPTQWYDPTFCATGHPFKRSNPDHAKFMDDLLDPGFNAKAVFGQMSDPVVPLG